MPVQNVSVSCVVDVFRPRRLKASFIYTCLLALSLLRTCREMFCRRIGSRRSCLFLLSVGWPAEERHRLGVAVNGEGCSQNGDGEQLPPPAVSRGLRAAACPTKRIARRGTSDSDGTGSVGECLRADLPGSFGQKSGRATDKRRGLEACVAGGTSADEAADLTRHTERRAVAMRSGRKSRGEEFAFSQREDSRQRSEEREIGLQGSTVVAKRHSLSVVDSGIDESTADGDKWHGDRQVLVEASLLLEKRRHRVKVRNVLPRCCAAGEWAQNAS